VMLAATGGTGALSADPTAPHRTEGSAA